MRVVKQKRATGYETVRLRVWKKTKYLAGWYIELKIGGRQWLVLPSDKRQLPGRQVKTSNDITTQEN